MFITARRQPITAFMAAGAKIAGFAALFRVFTVAFPALSADMTDILWALSALTMIVGNLAAISQSNIKRMLAYSAIAHAGYILMAFVPYGNKDVASHCDCRRHVLPCRLFVVTNFGSWGVVIAIEKPKAGDLRFQTTPGLAKKYPALAAAMTVFMLSFIGFPPTLGLVGKFYLFRSASKAASPGLPSSAWSPR
jgi:NADH-quinone oxidoreductase subunit N